MAISKPNLGEKLPDRRQIFPVFSVIVFVVFSWAIYRMSWQMQSWLYSLGINQILVLAAYVLTDALFESLLVLGMVLLLALALPGRFFKDKFEAQGTAVVAVWSAGAVLLQRHLDKLSSLTLQQLILLPFLILAWTVIIILLFSFILDRIRVITRVINTVADRLTVFSYIYIPLSLLGLIMVMIRNIF